MCIEEKMDLLGIKEILYRYADRCPVQRVGGSTFICQIGDEPLRFLHKIFGPVSPENLLIFPEIFGFGPPSDYSGFMRQSNGATLFDNCLYLYGLVLSFNRSLALKDQQPMSLTSEIESSLYRHENGYLWRPIGSVSGYNMLFELEMEASGYSRIISPDGEARVFDSVRELIGTLSLRLADLTNEHGFIDATRGNLDHELSNFVGS